MNLDKGLVTLAKRQTVSLTKTGAPPLRRVRMGLGWDPAEVGKNIDLDASCILYDHGLRSVAKVWFAKKHTKDRSVTHSGDNLTGAGEGDDETIVVQLDAIAADVLALLFTVNSYRKHPFTEIRNAFCRLIDDSTDQELVRFDLTESEPRTGVYMCVVSRSGDTWQMTSIGAFRDGKTVNAMVDPGADLLRELGIGPQRA